MKAIQNISGEGESISSSPIPRILIVDDEVRQMQALCETLPTYGIEAVGCISGELALELLRDERFDLVLTDLMMPGMDGIELLQTALTVDPDLVGVVMTGEGTIASAVEAMQAGALDYILKPFKISMALPVLSRSLEVRRLRLENAELHRRARERMDELGCFFSVSLDLLCIAGVDGYFKQVNPAWQTALGYPEDTLLSTPLVEFVHPEDRERTASEMANLSACGYEVVEFENRYRHIDGSYRRLSWTTSTAGNLIYAAARDVTEQRAMEAALRQAKELAEQANRAKSEFLSRMSHELRTPLNAILGFAQLLDMQYEDPGIKEATRSILKGGHHLLQLINEVLDLSRIEGGHLSISIEPVEVSMVVHQAIGLVRPIAESAGIQVEVDGEGYEGIYVWADRQRLLQVVINLVSNAIKYNREGGRVQIRCIAGANCKSRIEVSDTGIGISEEDRLSLFQPFRRFCHPGIEGTGLGLALSERFVRLMNGELGLAESTGAGSTFFVELDLADSPSLELPTIGNASPGNFFPLELAGKILSIEDNFSNMRLLEILFAKWQNLQLIPTAQGLTGLELAREHLPDLILLDLHLPDLMGDEVLRRLKADLTTRSIPVVVLSADANPDQIKAMRLSGCAEYLTKPLDLKRLFEVLRTYLPPTELRKSA